MWRDIGHPVAHGFVDGFLEGLLAGGDGHDFRAEHFHAIDVERLALAIHFAHVNDAFEAEHGGDGGGGDAVLARAGFGDDARLAHAPGHEDLAHGVVDFVRAGVEQVLALEINFRAAQFARQALGKIQRAWAVRRIGAGNNASSRWNSGSCCARKYSSSNCCSGCMSVSGTYRPP